MRLEKSHISESITDGVLKLYHNIGPVMARPRKIPTTLSEKKTSQLLISWKIWTRKKSYLQKYYR